MPDAAPRRLCTEHMRADAVVLPDGERKRFCQKQVRRCVRARPAADATRRANAPADPNASGKAPLAAFAPPAVAHASRC